MSARSEARAGAVGVGSRAPARAAAGPDRVSGSAAGPDRVSGAAAGPERVGGPDRGTGCTAGPERFPRRWLAAVVMITGALMDMIDVTVVNVALPTIHRDLGMTTTQLEWVVSGYMLAFAAGLIVAARLGDQLGRKRVFLLGVAVFGAASLGAGLAQSGNELIGARIVQGAAAAAMTPQVLASFRVIFGRRERGKAFAVYGAMLGLASALGLLLGGVLTEADLLGWSWRSVFFVNVPVAAAALAAGLWLIPETRTRQASRTDLPGALLLAGSLVAIVYPLLEGRQLGWPGWVWPVLGAGLLGLAGLAALERRRERRPDQQHGRPGRAPVAPLLQAGLLRIPAFAAGLGVQLAFAAGMQGFFLMFALWLQLGEHFSPLRAGLTAIAFSAGSFLTAPVAVPLAQRHGRRILAAGAAGMVAGIAGVDAGARYIGIAGSPWPVVPGLVVAGAGLALLVIPLVNVVLAAVPADAAGGASGLFGTAQQLGGAVGVALFGTVFFGYLGGGHSFEAALTGTAPYAMGAFALCGALSLLLPRTAVADDALLAEDALLADTDTGPLRRTHSDMGVTPMSL